MGMQIKDISDKAFSAYGKVITGLDVTGILKEMEHTPLPDDVIYVPSVPELEALPEALVIQGASDSDRLLQRSQYEIKRGRIPQKLRDQHCSDGSRPDHRKTAGY